MVLLSPRRGDRCNVNLEVLQGPRNDTLWVNSDLHPGVLCRGFRKGYYPNARVEQVSLLNIKPIRLVIIIMF